MAFSGSLLKYGSYNIPLSYIRLDTYKVIPNARMDLDSYRDADATLRRYALKHTVTKIEFQTKIMREADMETLMSNIRSNYISYEEKNANCEYWDPENGIYKSGILYIDANTEWTIYSAALGGGLMYNSTRFAFIEY